MSEFICFLITFAQLSEEWGNRLLKVALKVHRDQVPADAIEYPRECEANLRLLLPKHCQSIGPIVDIEVIFEAHIVERPEDNKAVLEDTLLRRLQPAYVNPEDRRKRLKTVAEVVDDLMATSCKEDLHQVLDVEDDEPPKNLDGTINTSEEAAAETAFSNMQFKSLFGRMIRNRYGLWEGNEDLAADCLRLDPKTSTATLQAVTEDAPVAPAGSGFMLGQVHPDDASAVIKKFFIAAARRKLGRKDPKS